MERIARVAASIVAVVGLGVLVGWYTGTELLTTVVPGYASMKPNTALSLVALGAGVTLLGRRGWAAALGALVVGIGGATLLEYTLNRSLGIDTVMPGLDLVGPQAARMAPATAVAMVLLGGAVVAVDRGRSGVARVLAMLAFAVSYVAVLGYVYGVRSLYAAGGYASVAVHTATCIAILSVALLLLDAEAGPVGLLRDRGGAGQLLRPMVPFLLLGPPALGALQLWAQGAGWFDSRFGVTLLVMSMTVTGGVLTLRAAARLHAVDRCRIAATAALVASNRTLETRVEERTHDLADANARLSSLIDTVPVGIVQIDTAGTVVAISAYSRMLSGRGADEAMGEGWQRSLHPDDVDRVRSEWREAVVAEHAYDTTCRLLTPDGTVRWVRVYNAVVRGEDDVVLGYLAAVLDVTALVAATDAASAANDRLSTLIRLVPVGIFELDADGSAVTTNEQWQALSGLEPQNSSGPGWTAAVHPDDVDRVRTEWGAAVAAGRAYSTGLRLVTPDGTISSVHLRTTPVRTSGGIVTGHLAAVSDVTELRAAEEEALEAVARFQAAFSSSPLGTALVSLDGEILEANRRLAQFTGRSTGALQGEQAEDLFEPAELADSEPWFDELMDGTIASHRMERRLRLAEGAPTWVEVSITVIHDGGRKQGLLYELADITARRMAETRAEHLALHDTLTGLPNRLLLVDRLRQSLLEAARHGRGVGVLFVDLDRFKIVNDTLGHHAGDAVLVKVATRLTRAARATDTVARVGGDEFVVVCPDVGSARDVLEIATNLRAAVARPISVGDQIAEVDASIGVAFGVGHDDAEVLLRNADQAMYHAKDRGRARYAVFDSDLRGRIERRLGTELGLRAAVERGEIEAWYQPIVDLQEPSLVAYEALARWRRPEVGIVLPETFISIAEETGLIKDIGATVLTQACLAAAAEPDGPAVSVNVSARQFVRHEFGAVVEGALRLSQLPPARLWLELTEGNVVEAIDSAARTFQDLRAQGVRIAIDDFGTGFSSFEHLRTFAVDMLKINMSFVHDVTGSDHDRAIVEGILRLADSLHLDVIAEGVETVSQRVLLRDLGCRYGQGYLFGRPSPTTTPRRHASR